MANTVVYLTHSSINSGNPIQIYCTNVQVGFNKVNTKTLNANYSDYPASVQSTGRNNVSYVLQSAKIDQGDLSYANWLALYNLENDEDDLLTLNVKYNNKWLVDSLGATTDIPVTVDGSIPADFDASDSKDAYQPKLSIRLVEVGSSV